jgi:hypothetical protein
VEAGRRKVLWRTHVELANVVLDHAVPSVGLVDPDLSLGGHVVESLLRVDSSLEGSGPRSGVDGSASLVGVRDVLPVDQEGDGVLGPGVASERSGDTGGSRGSDLGGLVSSLDHPTVDLGSDASPREVKAGQGIQSTHVNVVRVEVVGDVRVDTGPGLERLELELWLGHVRAVKVEVSELLGSRSGVVVSRVESLVAGGGERCSLGQWLFNGRGEEAGPRPTTETLTARQSKSNPSPRPARSASGDPRASAWPAW